MFVVPFLFALSVPQPGCHEIESESVLARDVAPFIPAFAGLPEDFLLGYVQASGAPKIFHGADLEHLAKNRGIELHGLDDLCLSRRTFVPQPDQIADAMRKTLGATGIKIDGMKIEILSSSQQPVPTGEIVFPRSGVQPVPGPEVSWNGYVQSGKGAKFPVLARARVTATMNRVVAAADLAPGKPIQPNQLRLEPVEDSPFDDAVVRELDQAVGSVAKANIPKGVPLRKSQIQRPLDVAGGDLVRVEVYSGRAHLSIEARAENAGMKGSTITVRNLDSGKEFQAQVMGKDKVTVGGRVE